MKKLCLFCILLAVFSWFPEVKALDPATVSAAAPQALELAMMWTPHAVSTLQSCGVGLWNIGKSMVELFCLPLALIQCTLGAPFGYFGDGVSNFVTGGAAPFKLVYHTVMLPVRLISLGAVR